MKTLLFSICLIICSTFSNCFSQNYSYSFNGKADTLFLNDLALNISKMDGVKEVKWRFKEEKASGEFIIFTNNYTDKSDPFPFKPEHLKALFIENRLTPLKLIELPN